MLVRQMHAFILSQDKLSLHTWAPHTAQSHVS